jgi:hypothetical protein
MGLVEWVERRLCSVYAGKGVATETFADADKLSKEKMKRFLSTVAYVKRLHEISLSNLK